MMVPHEVICSTKPTPIAEISRRTASEERRMFARPFVHIEIGLRIGRGPWPRPNLVGNGRDLGTQKTEALMPAPICAPVPSVSRYCITFVGQVANLPQIPT